MYRRDTVWPHLSPTSHQSIFFKKTTNCEVVVKLCDSWMVMSDGLDDSFYLDDMPCRSSVTWMKVLKCLKLGWWTP
jgi:hypothetical protein